MACGGCAAAQRAREEAARIAAGGAPNRQQPIRQPATPNQMHTNPGSNGRTQSFALILPTNKRLTFGSKLEAEAENVRRGMVGRVTAI